MNDKDEKIEKAVAAIAKRQFRIPKPSAFYCPIDESERWKAYGWNVEYVEVDGVLVARCFQ